MNFADQYHAVRFGAGTLDQSDRGKIVVRGADRANYLQGLLTNDMVALEPGSGCYAAYLTPQGRMITDLEALNLGDELLLDVPPSRRKLLVDRLNDLIFTEDVQILDRTDEWGLVSVHGPRSADVAVSALHSLGASEIPRAEELPSWLPYRHVRFELQGGPGVLVRRDDFAAIGCGIYLSTSAGGGVPSAAAALGWGALRDALQKAGSVAIGLEAAETLRIEAGRPAFGIDMNEETIPLEAGLEHRALSFTKGCYVGQEVIFRIVSRGHGRVARRLVGLTLEERPRPRPSTEGGVPSAAAALGCQVRGSRERGWGLRAFGASASLAEARWVPARAEAGGPASSEKSPAAVDPGPVGSLRGATLWHDDKEVGHVTSAAFSPAVEKVIALGYVHRDLASPGTSVLVSADDEKIPATVARVI